MAAITPSSPEDGRSWSEPPEDDNGTGNGPSSGAYDGPVICLFSGFRDGFAGGVMGSIFGLGQGIWKKQGFKGSIREAGSSAKMFALLSGVHTLVTCFLRRLRGKQDAINAGIAGCATGLALSAPGTPDALLRSCLTFGAFSYILERFNKPQPALAASVNSSLFDERRPVHRQMPLQISFPVLPPFVLPPPFVDSHEFLRTIKLGRFMSFKR